MEIPYEHSGLGFSSPFFTEAMLEIIEDLIVIKLSYYIGCNNLF